MKTTSIAIALIFFLNAISLGQYSVVHHFDEEVQSPKTSGVYQGRVYGLTDYYGTTDAMGQFIDNAALFSFNLDGSDFQHRNVITELGGFGPREIGAGPLAFDQGLLYGTQDLGTPYVASVNDLVPTRFPQRNTNWVNPVIVGDSFVVGVESSTGTFGVDIASLADGTSTSTTFFADTPVNSIATDGTNVFASSLGAPNVFEGRVVSISDTGAVNVLYANESSTYGLAYSSNTLYGIGDDGLFRVNVDGSGFETLKSDIIGTRIVVEDDTIYGVARPTFSGVSQTEQLFEIGTDGSDFQVLHDFGSITNDGTTLNSDLVIIGSSLFGSTENGGEDGYGTYYRFDLDTDQNAVPEPTSLTTWLFLVLSCIGVRWMRTTHSTIAKP